MILLKRLLPNILLNKKVTKNGEQGFVLVMVIMFLAMFMVLGTMLMYKITTTVKMSGINKMGIMRFQGAEGGAIAVASYMSKYKRTDTPQDILVTGDYSVTTKVLGDTISYPIGFASMWKGVNMQINSVSPPAPNDKTEIEMVVFVPISPVGYGNE